MQRLGHSAPILQPAAQNWHSFPDRRVKPHHLPVKYLPRCRRKVTTILTGPGRLRALVVLIRARYLRRLSAGRLSSKVAADRSIPMAHCTRSAPETAGPLRPLDNCQDTPVLERSIDPTAVSGVGSPSSGKRRAGVDRRLGLLADFACMQFNAAPALAGSGITLST